MSGVGGASDKGANVQEGANRPGPLYKTGETVQHSE